MMTASEMFWIWPLMWVWPVLAIVMLGLLVHFCRELVRNK